MPFPSRFGSTVPGSVASKTSYCLPTVPEVGERHVADVGSTGDFGDYGTLVSFKLGTDISGQPAVPEDLMTLGQLKSGLAAKKKKMEKSYNRYSRAGRPNPVPASGSQESD